MAQTIRNVATFVSAALLLTVFSQILYTLMLSGVGIIEGWPLRSTIWTAELLLFASIALAALVGMVRSPDLHFGWSALALAGITNMIQSGIGLSMFLPATEAGEAFSPVMSTVLAGSFLFYYLAKVILGMAAVIFGLSVFRNNSGFARLVGLASLLTGAIAMILNIAAVHLGLGAVSIAGASGATATFFAGCAIWYSVRQQK